jgi:hypothetical protein
MKISRTTQVKLLFLVCVFHNINAYAFSDSRNEKWEFFLTPQFTNSKVLEFENGSNASINKRSSLGFGLGYNLNTHIEFSMIFATSNSNYTGTLIPEDDPGNPVKVSSNLYTSSINLGVTYNFMSTPFTPYVSANIGSTYIDSGVPTGDITTGCWWDPWYGYICTPIAQTYTATKFNYGVGVGLRYDFNRKLYVKGGVAKNIIDIGSKNTADFTSYQLFFGFMF